MTAAQRIERLSDTITLYLGDSAEILPTLGRFDAIVTDPPYGINENSKKVASRSNATKAKDYGEFDWDKSAPPPELIKLLCDVSKWQIIFGGNYFALPPTSCWLVWNKQSTGDFADCELAWTNLKKAVRLIDWRWNGMIRKGDDVRVHPTQKPLGVMKWCLGHLPEDARRVCDPFMGSGTTGVACAALRRPFVGIERDPRYFDAACKRIAEEIARPDLFEPPAPAPVKAESLSLF